MIKIKSVNVNNYEYWVNKFEPTIEIPDLNGQMKRNLLNPNFDTFVMLEKDEVICFFGLFHQRLGAAAAWIIPGVLIEKFKFGFFKSIHRMLDFAYIRLGLHRIEIAISTEWKKGGKWASKLGFQLEGVSRAYDSNFQDHYIYSRIEPWAQKQQ